MWCSIEVREKNHCVNQPCPTAVGEWGNVVDHANNISLIPTTAVRVIDGPTLCIRSLCFGPPIAFPTPLRIGSPDPHSTP